MICLYTAEEFIDLVLEEKDIGFKYEVTLAAEKELYKIYKLKFNEKIWICKYTLDYTKFYDNNSTRMKDVIINNIFVPPYGLELFVERQTKNRMIYSCNYLTQTTSFRPEDVICLSNDDKVILDYIYKKCEDLVYLS